MVTFCADGKRPMRDFVDKHNRTTPRMSQVISNIDNLSKVLATLEASISRVITEASPINPMPNEKTPAVCFSCTIRVVDNVNQTCKIIEKASRMEIEILHGFLEKYRVYPKRLSDHI